MHQQLGFIDPKYKNHICKLENPSMDLNNLPMYGTYKKLVTTLIDMVLKNSEADTSLFIYNSHGKTIYALIYVDDLIIIRNNPSHVNSFIKIL